MPTQRSNEEVQVPFGMFGKHLCLTQQMSSISLQNYFKQKKQICSGAIFDLSRATQPRNQNSDLLQQWQDQSDKSKPLNLLRVTSALTQARPKFNGYKTEYQGNKNHPIPFAKQKLDSRPISENYGGDLHAFQKVEQQMSEISNSVAWAPKPQLLYQPIQANFNSQRTSTHNLNDLIPKNPQKQFKMQIKLQNQVNNSHRRLRSQAFDNNLMSEIREINKEKNKEKHSLDSKFFKTFMEFQKGHVKFGESLDLRSSGLSLMQD